MRPVCDRKGGERIANSAESQLPKSDHSALPQTFGLPPKILEADDSPAKGDGNCVGSVAGVQLFENVLDVGIYSGLGNCQTVRHLFVLKAAGDQLQDLDLPRRDIGPGKTLGDASANFV